MKRATVINIYIVAVMVVLSFIAYNAFTTPMPTRTPDAQVSLYDNVPKAKPGPPPVATGVEIDEAFLYMQIPRFGENWLWTALEGTSLDVLDRGPGHFPDTELPGEEGNVAFAAHRATHGDPFIDFDLLEKGDEIILSQSGGRWIYEVTQEPKIVSPDATWILDDFAEGEWLTLTTCWPKYGSEKRMYIRAELTEAY